MIPATALSTAAPPAISTIVVGWVLTMPPIHPRTPMRNPVPTMTQRRRCARAIASRSRSRCSTPDASSFQPRTRAASDLRSEATSGGAVMFWATPPTSYTPRTVRQAASAAPLPESEVPGGEEGVDCVPRPLEGRPATFAAVDDRQDAEHPPPFGFDDAGRLLRGAAGGDHVLHDDRASAGREAPLDAFPRAVVLRLLTDGEGVEWRAARAGGGGDGGGNRVRAEGQPADQLRPPAAGGGALETPGADQHETFPRHGGLPGVDVEGRSASRGEHEVTPAHGALEEHFQKTLPQAGALVHRAVVVA